MRRDKKSRGSLLRFVVLERRRPARPARGSRPRAAAGCLRRGRARLSASHRCPQRAQWRRLTGNGTDDAHDAATGRPTTVRAMTALAGATTAPTTSGTPRRPPRPRAGASTSRTLLARRRVLGLLGGLGAAAPRSPPAGADGPSGRRPADLLHLLERLVQLVVAARSSSAAAACRAAEVPDETGGPYPGDGSNGPNVLDDSGIVRSDITSQLRRRRRPRPQGIPLTVNLTVTDRERLLRAGRSGGLPVALRPRRPVLDVLPGRQDENYLRGVQATDAVGTATFTTIFPAAYDGRWPHIHFEVYQSVADATTDGPIVKTSQIALPEAACRRSTPQRATRPAPSNLARTSLTQDNVFGDDGGIYQLATVTGNAADGYVANLTIGV